MTLAIAANDASTFIKLACGTVTGGRFIAVNDCTMAFSFAIGSGGGSGSPSAAEAFAKALA